MNFAQPAWLALLLLVPILGVAAVLIARLKRQQWSAFTATRLRPSLLRRVSSLPRWLAFIFLCAAITAAVVALARPQADAGTKAEKTIGRNVMIALDISRSMRVADVKPDRLAQAKVLIAELADAMPNERIGLIGFAGTPNTFAPLTIDHGALKDTLDQIDESWAPLGGSDLAAAVSLATETLKKTGQKNNALIILSDGEEVSGEGERSELEAMASQAERSGVYIITIGVGTEDGGFVPKKDFPNGQMVDRSGRPVISRLQTEVLRKLATSTQGRFATAGSGIDIPTLVKSLVQGMDAFEMEGRERRISIEFFQWLLLPAVLFLILSIVSATRWRGVQTAVLALGFCLIGDSLHASEASSAKMLLTEKRHSDAQKRYHELAEATRRAEPKARFHLGEATAAYRAGAFRDARSAFSQALESSDSQVLGSAHLGMGNSLFQLGWQTLAADAYPNDPSQVPDLDRFSTLVKEALAKLRETDASDTSESGGYLQFESLMTNWTDAVRHFESSTQRLPADPAPANNRKLTLTYLQRLAELLEAEKNETEQAMPQTGPGPPQEGEGDEEGDEEGEGEGKGGKSKKPGKNGKPEKGKDQDGPGGKKKQDDSPGKSEAPDPNESPQQRAKRILKENADSEKGPLAPGRRDFGDAEKDW